MTRPTTQRIGSISLRATRGPDDEGRWYWRATAPRSQGRRSLWCGWATEVEATRTVADLAARGPIAPGQRVRTVGALLDAWVAAQRSRPDLAARTVRSYATAVRRLQADVGSVVIARWDAAAAARWQDHAARLRAASTVGLDRRVLAMAWRWGRDRDVVPDRELRMARPPRRPEPEPDPSSAELDKTIAWLAHHAPPWVHRALVLQGHLGARIGEIAALTWDRVDLAAGVLVLVGKTGRRTVPIPRPLAPLLDAWSVGADLEGSVVGVAPSTVTSDVGRHIAAACTAVGAPHWTTHALRRAAADRMAHARVDVAVAAAWLGHSPEIMLRHYRRVRPEDLRAAEYQLWGDEGTVIALRRE